MDKVKTFVADKVSSLPPTLKAPYSFKQKLIMLVAFLVLIGVGFFIYTYIQPDTVLKKKVPVLMVRDAYPNGMDISENSDLIINFNYQVEAHHMGDYVEVTPPLKGSWKQGTTPTEVTFEPSERFLTGANYKVVIKSGLSAANGAKLVEDYKYYFKVTGRADIITFAKNDMEGKFMSFPQSSGAELKIKVGTSLKNPSVKIFKATAQDALNSLVYSVQETEYMDANYPKSGIYNDTFVDTAKMLPVKVYETVETDQMINLKEPVGLYLLQGFDGVTNVSNAWVSLNDSAVYFRQDDQKVVLGAQDIYTQVPTSGYQVRFMTLLDTPKQLGQYTLSNIQDYPFDGTKRLDLIVAQKGEDVMIVPVGMPNSQADVLPLTNLNQDKQLFLYTDRPIYRKGDTVFYRGLVRIDNDGIYKNTPVGTKVNVYLPDYKTSEMKKVVDQSVTTNEGGVFSGQFKIAEDIDLGNKYLYATTSSEKDGYDQSISASFDIADYIKPDFDLTVNVEKGEYTKGDKIKATISGRYFNGQPFANQQLYYQFYSKDYYETEKAVYNKSFALNGWGGMCGAGGWGDYYGETVGIQQTIDLDAQGKAFVELDTKELKGDLSQDVTLLAFKDNQNYSSANPSPDPYSSNKNQITSARNAIVHAGEFNIFFLPGTSSVVTGEPFQFGFYAENERGEKLANTEFDYAITKNTYNNTSNEYDRANMKTGKLATNNEGIGRITEIFTPEQKDASYYLLVSRKDSRGNIVESQKYIYFLDKASQNSAQYGYGNQATILNIVSSKTNLTVGAQASLEIESPQDMTAFVTFDRGRVYRPQWLALKKGRNTFTFPVEDTFAPSITPSFGFIYQGKYHIEGLSLNVPALHKLLGVSVFTDKLQYAPGDTALVTVETKDAAGNFVAADISVGIVDKAIYALRKNSTPPIHSDFYFFRRRTTLDSSSLSIIGVYDNRGGGGGGGGGGDSFGKDVDTLYWDAKLRTGTDGRITIPVPVGSMETTWKILTYASTEDTKVGQSDFDMLVAK